MLQSLRNYFPRWLIAIFLGILIFTMLFLGLYNPQSEAYKKANTAIMQINKKIIRHIEFESTYEGLKQQKQLQLGASFKLTPLMERQLREQAMQQLVIAEVLKQNAAKRGYRIHPKDLTITLRKIPAFQVQQQFSLAKFEEMLIKIGYNRSAFLSALMEEETIAQVRSGIIDSAFVIPMEVNTAIRLVKQKRNFDYMEIPANHFIKQAKVSEQEIRDYYEQHLTEFRALEQVSLDYVLLSLANIITRLKAQYPTWNQEHLHQKAQQKFKEDLAMLQKYHLKYPASLKEIAKVLSYPIQSTELFNRINGQSEITKDPKVITTAFNSKTLKSDHAAIISLDADRVLYFKIKQHKPVYLISFQNVAQKIRQYLCLKKAQKMAQQYGEKMVEQWNKKNVEPSKLGSDFKWNTLKQTTRYDTKVPSVILNAAFKMPYNRNETNMIGFVSSNGNYVIIRLNQVIYGLVNQFKGSQYQLYQEELALEAGQFEYNVYVRQNVHRAKINFLFNPLN